MNCLHPDHIHSMTLQNKQKKEKEKTKEVWLLRNVQFELISELSPQPPLTHDTCLYEACLRVTCSLRIFHPQMIPAPLHYAPLTPAGKCGLCQLWSTHTKQQQVSTKNILLWCNASLASMRGMMHTVSTWNGRPFTLKRKPSSYYKVRWDSHRVYIDLQTPSIPTIAIKSTKIIHVYVITFQTFMLPMRRDYTYLDLWLQ